MANILDVFRTHTGERLVDKTKELTSLEIEKLERAFTFSLPALLSIFQKYQVQATGDQKDLTSFIEKSDLIQEGEKIISEKFHREHIDLIKNCATLFDMDSTNFEKVLKISAAFLDATITRMKTAETDALFLELVETLTGGSVKYDKLFIRTLVKNEDDPGIIDSSEEIALGNKKDDNDQSILGGYSGGR